MPSIVDFKSISCILYSVSKHETATIKDRSTWHEHAFYLVVDFDVIIVNTHVHADHITGSGKLKQSLDGCKSVLGEDSGAQADVYVAQGEKFKVGQIEIEARKTPGHTNGNSSVPHDEYG